MVTPSCVKAFWFMEGFRFWVMGETFISFLASFLEVSSALQAVNWGVKEGSLSRERSPVAGMALKGCRDWGRDLDPVGCKLLPPALPLRAVSLGKGNSLQLRTGSGVETLCELSALVLSAS